MASNENDIYHELYDMCRYGANQNVGHILDSGLRADWVNRRDRNRSLLMATAWKDNVEACQLLIQAATQQENLSNLLSLRDAAHMTALHVCAKQNAVRVAELLLHTEIDPNATADNDVTPLMICADLGYTEIARLLLNHPKIQLDMQTTRGFTALMKAAFENKEDVAIELIDRGARLDLAANSGFTALHLCAQLGRLQLTQRILAKMGGSIQGQIDRVTKLEFKGNTAFNLAALNGHAEIMQLLKDLGAKIDVRNSDGATALDQVKRNALSGTTAASSDGIIKLLESWYSSLSAQQVTFETVRDAVLKGDPSLVRQLLGPAGTSTITRNSQQACTLLLLSAAICSQDLVRLMLEEIGDTSTVNMQAGEDYEKMTPLQAAVQGGSLDCVRLLLDRGASPSSRNSAGCNSLHLCAEFNSPGEIVRLLLSKASMPADAEARNKEGRTPVEIAASKGSVNALRELLGRQYSGQLSDTDQQALSEIIRLADEMKQHKASLVAQEFLQRARPAFNNELWVSQLFTATMECNSQLVEQLLKGAGHSVKKFVDQRYHIEPKWTALMAAAWSNATDICDLLLSHGANPNERDSTLGITALHIAVQQNSLEVARTLMDHKDTDLNAKSKDERTPLIRAAWLDRREIGKLLLEKRADVNAQELDGFSALHFCAQENLADFTNLLISHDIKLELITSVKKQKNTAFTLAAIKGHVEMIELLANAGTNIYYTSMKGNALELARRAKMNAVETLLLQLDSEREKKWEKLKSPRPQGPNRLTSEPGPGVVTMDALQTQVPDLSAIEISSNLNSSSVPPISGIEYSMTAQPRGICVIINNEEFGNPKNKRVGSQKDVDALAKLFRDTLKFRVQVHQNLDKADIMAVMRSIASGNRHSSYNCLAVFLMSHGGSRILFGSDDQPVILEDVYALFRQCQSLNGKPKLFFVQACRSPNNSEANVDGANPGRSSLSQQPSDSVPAAPKKQDFLLSYATTDGDLALRHTVDGSPFVQIFCDVVNQKYKEYHLIDLLTQVRAQVELARQVLYNVQGSVPIDESTLLRQVWFRDLN